jgi:hypothetical protein
MNGLMCCVFILNGSTFKYQLDSFSSVLTAELLAFCKAHVTVVNLPPGKFWLWTNSLSAVKGLQSPYFTYPLVLDLRTTYHAFAKLDLAWILGHVGIGGNKATGAAARDTTI